MSKRARGPAEQHLIDAGTQDEFYLLATFLLWLSGILYVTHALPPYDPGVLRADGRIIYMCYLLFAIGGSIKLISFAMARWDKIYSLLGQFIGLTQTTTGATVVAFALFYTGRDGIFLGPVMAAIALANLRRMYHVWDALRHAPFRMKLAREMAVVIKDEHDHPH